MDIKFYCLRLQVFLLHILIWLHLKKNVWYQCEINLGKRLTDKLMTKIGE